MDLELAGDLIDIETIRDRAGIRDLPRAELVWHGPLKENQRQRADMPAKMVESDSLNCTGMKHMASARRNSSARGPRLDLGRRLSGAEDSLSPSAMMDTRPSFERKKIYPDLPDNDAELDGFESSMKSGEDYLFSADRFVAIEVPPAVRASLPRAVRT